MRVDVTPLEYDLVSEGLIEKAQLDDLRDRFGVEKLHLQAGDDIGDEFKTAEWNAIRSIQDYQRDQITPTFARGKSPWISRESGNCMTHSLRTMELLEYCGFESALTFVNEHTFVIVRSSKPETGFLYMINADERRLSLGEISSANQIFSAEITEQIAEFGFDRLIVDSLRTKVLRERAAKTSSGDKYGRDVYQTPWVDANYPAAAIVGAQTAKEAVWYYAILNSTLGIRSKNPDDHVQAVIDIAKAMKETNLQQETRQKYNGTLKNFKHQVRLWAHQGIPPERLDEVIEAFSATMPETFSREVFFGDVYRLFATYSRMGGSALQELFGKSIERYKSAQERSRGGASEVAAAKIGKCLRLAQSAGVLV